MVNALNINATVGLFFEDWVEIREGETLEYEVSLYEDADLDKVRISLSMSRSTISWSFAKNQQRWLWVSELWSTADKRYTRP